MRTPDWGWLPIGAVPEAASCCKDEGTEVVFARFGGEDAVFARGDGALYRDLSGLRLSGGGKICPPNHENRLALGAHLPHTAPRALGRACASFGLGDRLGLCARAHLEALRGTPLKPVLAQQSLRELTFMRRSYAGVIDAAAYGVFRAGWRGGWGADGDHLKTLDAIRAALEQGCTMITLDGSDALGEPAPGGAFADLPEERRAALLADYLGDPAAVRLGLRFDLEILARLFDLYEPCVALAERAHREAILPAGREVDLEISLDETAEVTTHEAHYFVARELTRRGVPYVGVAPRFVGEFHKAVDYIGSLPELERDLAAHAAVAAHFGHKLSVHSGSDKFSAYPVIARAAGERYHIKTSGTSWLCAVEVLARTEPALYRRMYACALAHFAEAKRAYVVHADPARLPDIETLPDARLGETLFSDDARQLMHITYGFLFAGEPLAKDLRRALERRQNELETAVTRHIRAHVAALGYAQNGPRQDEQEE